MYAQSGRIVDIIWKEQENEEVFSYAIGACYGAAYVLRSPSRRN